MKIIFQKSEKLLRPCNDFIFGSYKINPSLLARCLAGTSRRVCIFLAYWSDAAQVMVDRTLAWTTKGIYLHVDCELLTFFLSAKIDVFYLLTGAKVSLFYQKNKVLPFSLGKKMLFCFSAIKTVATTTFPIIVSTLY